MKSVSVSEMRDGLEATVERVVQDKERVILCRNGKEIAALVPISDLDLIEELEDLKAAEKALAEAGPNIPYEEVRRELGLR